MKRKFLCVIPARKGSKGIPGKNLKPLNATPLIDYTLREAREVFDEQDICVSTDWPELKKHVEDTGLYVPFLRPAELATDMAGSREVLLHALEHYSAKGVDYENLVLLQITSPFRTAGHLRESIKLMKNDVEAVISVKETSANPYYILFEENEGGFLRPSKEGTFTRRQDCPAVYEVNGAVYILNADALRSKGIGKIGRIVKYVMSRESSFDLDESLDWEIAECLLKSGFIKTCQ